MLFLANREVEVSFAFSKLKDKKKRKVHDKNVSLFSLI